MQAEDEFVTITPKFTSPAMHFVAVSKSARLVAALSMRCLSCAKGGLVYCLGVALCVCDVQGSFGPFDPNTTVRVPLWLALQLRKREKCRVHWPRWLSVGTP